METSEKLVSVLQGCQEVVFGLKSRVQDSSQQAYKGGLSSIFSIDLFLGQGNTETKYIANQEVTK